MFEGLPMTIIDIDKPIQNSNYQNRLNEYTAFSDDGNYAFNATFVLSGKQITTLLPLPSTVPPSGDFIYLQLFVAISGDSSFYTLRKNFPSYMLLYTYEGTGLLEYEGKTYKLQPGDGFLIDCQKEHLYKTVGESWYHSDLHFYGGSSHLLYNEFKKSKAAKFTCDNQKQFQAYLERILKYSRQISKHTEYFISDSISSLIHYILVENEKNFSYIPDEYRYMLKYIESNYRKTLTVDHLSKFFGISRYHLSRKFKEYTGFSPTDYIIELRINHAKFLLSNTDIPAYKVGELVGINNEANFLRLFKKRTGKTPGQFRESSFMT